MINRFSFNPIIILSLLLFNLLYAQEQDRVWIFFKDKGMNSIKKIPNRYNVELTPKAIERRLLKASGQPFDFSDLPIEKTYIKQIQELGVTIHRRSKWFNGVSAYLNNVDTEIITNLSFVKNIEPVRKFIYKNDTKIKGMALPKVNDLDYGYSRDQNEIIGIISGHNFGYQGQGVRIALFDTGFLLTHEALQHLNIIDTWDFVNNDAIVSNEEGEDSQSQHNHGSKVLSTIAGYKPGELIGPAYQSEFLLAKTEYVPSETHVEEDNWAAAVEWADNLGADIISTSVGYSYDFDEGEDYTYEDMDGNTTIITRAADMAVKKGIAVFSSAGNEGNDPWYYITAPADGDSVLAIGSVGSGGTVSYFSSHGPTYDGRIKPDLMAQGSSIYTISPNSYSDYTLSQGTSFACPLAAGAAAILLSINPSLTPMELKDLLISGASRSNDPNNTFGYGLINLEESIQIMIDDPKVEISSFDIKTQEGTNIIKWTSTMEIYNSEWIISRKGNQGDFYIISRINGENLNFIEKTYTFTDFDIKGGEEFTYKLSALFDTGETIVIDSANVIGIEPETIKLLQNFPNPFNPTTHFIFSLTSSTRTSLKIYNINGKLIKTVVNRFLDGDRFHHYEWDGRNEAGLSVASGNYFAMLKAGDTTKIIKLLYLK